MESISTTGNKKGLAQILLFLKHAKKIEGKTKFQKMMFLAQKENKLSKEFEFIKYNYGPYSFELTKDIEALEKKGFLTIEKEEFSTDNEFSGKRFLFKLTKKGKKFVKDNKNDFEIDSKVITETVKKWNKKPMGDIIRYVYSKYM
ncbi:MAG: hypothetical protein DRP06_03030 [Candidatus Aenigmatarchaeota archaeon]|nr:MAG: hypothetical protein DRP06_03030 [Candidatus Aenigmarchaeota archaeon]